MNVIGAGLAGLVVLLAVAPTFVQSQKLEYAVPRNFVDVKFVPATDLPFPNDTDSNSPAFWDGDDFYVFNSIAGQPRRARGTRLDDAQDTNPDGQSVQYNRDDIGGGRWLEAVIYDHETGNLYGWYHNEIPVSCPQGDRVYPRIGAVFSQDDGATWDELSPEPDAAIILSASDDTMSCDTRHPTNIGGVGDFSVILDNQPNPADRYLYFIFSSYSGPLEEQGVSFARMLWIDRDQPFDRFSGESKALKWYRGLWAEPGIGGHSTAIFDDNQKVTWTSINNNGYWGPSVHWNVNLNKFILLMNRSKGGDYETEGIYMTYTTNLANPRMWAMPKKIISDGQGWYPQVIGEPGIHGTDKLSGKQARYFNRGSSTSFIVFTDTSPPAAGRPGRP